MEQLYPQHVPVYATERERERIWRRCVDHGDPVIAVRDARRGFIVRYDLQHLGVSLSEPAVRALRERTRAFRTYPTGTDPISESEGVGGEAGPVSGDLHAGSERAARELGSRLSALVFDESNWVAGGAKRGT